MEMPVLNGPETIAAIGSTPPESRAENAGLHAARGFITAISLSLLLWAIPILALIVFS